MAEEDEQLGLEQRLERAISSRLQHFADQADSLTMESVRRLLEKDLGLEKFALDVHKGLIRQYMEKNMDGVGDGKSKEDTGNVEKDARFSKEETEASPKQLKTKKNPKRSSAKDEEMEDSPIMGVLSPKSELGLQGSSVNESQIEKALWQRADYFHENSEKITMAGVRRLVEEDLGLERCTLDPFKKFISRQIDRVLSSPKEPVSVKDKKIDSKNLKGKRSEKVVRKDRSGSSDSDSVEADSKLKRRKEAAPIRNIKKSEQLNKRKKSEESDLDVSGDKPNKLAKILKVAGDDYDQEGSVSEDGQSQSSGGKPAQTKEKSAPAYSKNVENLKMIIKACGMSVAPSIYKKAKQVPDRERESFLVKELEGILSREGVSRNPSDKEIKDCKKRKETARELEGIDTSNIISSARRRQTFSFAVHLPLDAQPKKKKHDAKDRKMKNQVDEDHDNDNEVEKEKEKEEEEEEGKEEEGKKRKKEEKEEEEEDELEVEDDDEEDDEDDDDDDEDNEESDEDDNDESD